MSELRHYVKCQFCAGYAPVPSDGGEIPLNWFFVARPREAKLEEQHEAIVMGLHGRETITVTTHVDRWLFCSEDCLAHVAELGGTAT